MEKSTVKKIKIRMENSTEYGEFDIKCSVIGEEKNAYVYTNKSGSVKLEAGKYIIRISRRDPWEDAPIINFIGLTFMRFYHFWWGDFLPFAVEGNLELEVKENTNVMLWLEYDGTLQARCDEQRDWMTVGKVITSKKTIRWWKAGAIYQITLLAIMVLLIGVIAGAIGKSIVLFGVALLVNIVVSVQMGKIVAQKSKFFKKFCDRES
jgi:hypothetical protein